MPRLPVGLLDRSDLNLAPAAGFSGHFPHNPFPPHCHRLTPSAITQQMVALGPLIVQSTVSFPDLLEEVIPQCAVAMLLPLDDRT
jgi:hypothetical protein